MDKNIPQIRFRGFEEQWVEKILGEIGTFKSNGVDKTINVQDTPINLLNYMDVYKRRKVTPLNCEELMQVTATNRQLKENDVQAGDVFFTPSSETADDIGHVSVIEENLPRTCYSYHLMRFRPNQGEFYKIFPNYSFASEAVRKQLVFEAQGVQRFVISKESFENIRVSLPSLPEQEKIGELFRNLDNLIDEEQKRLDKLRALKAALLQKMFPSDNPDNTLNGGGNSLIMSDLRISENFITPWKKIYLKDVCQVQNGFAFHSTSFIKSGIPIIRIADIYNGEVNTDNSVCCTMELDSQFEIVQGDFVIAMSGATVGKIGIYNDTKKAYINQRVGKFVVNREKAIPLFIFYALQGKTFEYYIYSTLTMGAQPNISAQQIEAFEFYIPSNREEQQQIGNFFRTQDEQIAHTAQ